MGASPQSHYIETSQTNKVLVTKYYEESQASLKLIEASQEVLVIGAGLIGLDLAYSLSLQGKRVKLIEAAERPDFYQTDAELIAPVMAEMSTHHVTFINNKRVTAIHEIEGKVVAHTEQGDTFQGDLAILAINFRPNTHLCKDKWLVLWIRPFWLMKTYRPARLISMPLETWFHCILVYWEWITIHL